MRNNLLTYFVIILLFSTIIYIIYSIILINEKIDNIKKLNNNFLPDHSHLDHSHLGLNFYQPNKNRHGVLKDANEGREFKLYKSVKFYNNNFIIVGGNPEDKNKDQGKGIIITSSQNGSLWKLKKSNTDNLFRDIVYSKKLKLYLAVGDFGSITISKDLENWIPVEAPNDSQICAIAYGNETFITSGNYGTIHTSKDGINWKNIPRSQTGLYDGDLYKIGFGKKMFFTLGYDGRLYTSYDDGESWDLIDSGTTTNLYGAYFINDEFIAVGGAGTMIKSKDGKNWKKVNVNNHPYQFRAYAYANDLHVLVGHKGYIFTSSDGINWVEQDSKVAADLLSIAYGNSMFVAVGAYGSILTSYDGVKWDLQMPYLR